MEIQYSQEASRRWNLQIVFFETRYSWLQPPAGEKKGVRRKGSDRAKARFQRHLLDPWIYSKHKYLDVLVGAVLCVFAKREIGNIFVQVRA